MTHTSHPPWFDYPNITYSRLQIVISFCNSLHPTPLVLTLS
jgi:hypothetical protein